MGAARVAWTEAKGAGKAAVEAESGRRCSARIKVVVVAEPQWMSPNNSRGSTERRPPRRADMQSRGRRSSLPENRRRRMGKKVGEEDGRN